MWLKRATGGFLSRDFRDIGELAGYFYVISEVLGMLTVVLQIRLPHVEASPAGSGV